MEVQIVPAQVPRRVSTGFFSVARAHGFGLLFGGIWALVGATMMCGFGAVALAAPHFLIGSLIAAAFFLAGGLIVAVALYRSAVRRWIYNHGHLVRGRVVHSEVDRTFRKNGQHARRLTFAYEDQSGHTHTQVDTSFDHAAAEAVAGQEEVDLIVDPYDPGTVYCPALHGVRFAPAPAPDRHPRSASVWSGTVLPQSGTWSCELGPWADLPPRPWWIRGAAADTGDHGKLVADEHGLHLEDASGVLHTVSWEEPFTVHATTWPGQSGDLELNLTVRPRSAAPTDRGIQFKSRVPTHLVKDDVERKQTRFATVPSESFSELYDRLRYHSAVQGTALHLMGDCAEPIASEALAEAVVEVEG